MRSRILFLLALVLGASAGFTTTGYSDEQARQQCYYTVGVDRPTDCTTCANTCANGACCGIIRVQ